MVEVYIHWLFFQLSTSLASAGQVDFAYFGVHDQADINRIPKIFWLVREGDLMNLVNCYNNVSMFDVHIVGIIPFLEVADVNVWNCM